MTWCAPRLPCTPKCTSARAGWSRPADLLYERGIRAGAEIRFPHLGEYLALARLEQGRGRLEIRGGIAGGPPWVVRI
jgi:hypothetical protein